MGKPATQLTWHKVSEKDALPEGRVTTVPAGTHVLLHNQQLGKISKEQRAGQFPVWKTDLHNPDFSKYADICGAKGFRVTHADELESAMTAARDVLGPAMVEVMADPDLV